MKTLAILALAPWVLTCLPATAEPPPDALTQQVLILTNESTLIGQVERIEGGYRLRSQRGESVLPARQVLRVCAGLKEAYFYLQGRANLRDPHERYRLARWCWEQGLRVEARQEVEAALVLAPKYEDARQLLRQLEAAAKTQVTTPIAVAAVDSKGDAAGQRSTAQSLPIANSLDGWERALTRPATKEFTLRVQPLLLNGCGAGACHGGDQTRGGFLLQRSPSATAQSPQFTRQNLIQALALVNRKEPGQSPLLKKALEPHGGGDSAPLSGQDSAAYRTLAAWLDQVAPAAESTGASTLTTPTINKPATAGNTFADGRREEEPTPDAKGAISRTPEELTKEDALRQLLERKSPGARPPGGGGDGNALIPLPKTEELEKLQNNKLDGLLQTGAPPMIGGGQVVGRPAVANDIGSKEARPSSGASAARFESNSNDPYDPAPFNRHFHKTP